RGLRQRGARLALELLPAARRRAARARGARRHGARERGRARIGVGVETLTAAQALARLRAGNARFVRGRARFPTVRKEILAALAKSQRPYATILGCSDSRV